MASGTGIYAGSFGSSSGVPSISSYGNAFSGGLDLISAGSSLSSAIFNAQALKSQSQYQANQFEFNAQMAEIQARDAIRRGQEMQRRLRLSGQKLKGAQRASYAGQGVQLDTDTPAAVADETNQLVTLDALQIQNNAWREAFGYKVQTMELRGDEALAAIAGNFNASQTLISGGMSALNYGMRAGYFGQEAYKDYKGT